MDIRQIYWHTEGHDGTPDGMEDDAFTYCPLCGRRLAHDRVDRQPRKLCSGCGYIHFRNPAPIVSLLIIQGDRVLLGKRPSTRGEEYWATPSGYILPAIARKSINLPAGILIDLLYGFVMAGVFLVLYPSLPGELEIVKGLSFALMVWFFRVVMSVASQWMMYMIPVRCLLYTAAAGLGEMLVLGVLYAYNIRTFVMLRYRDDPRLLPRIATLLSDERADNGYLCRRPAFNDHTKSCIRGSTKALMAFAELPEDWDHPRCRALVDYFLRRRIFFRSGGSTEVIRSELVSTIFPFVISGSLLEPLYALSRMGYAGYPALEPAWQALAEKTDAEGRVCLDYHPPSPFVPGRKGEANKWTTLYAALAMWCTT